MIWIKRQTKKTWDNKQHPNNIYLVQYSFDVETGYPVLSGYVSSESSDSRNIYVQLSIK